MIVLYVTCASKEEAKKIASALLEKKLVACANFFPIENMYRWEGKITEGKEYVLLLKTTEEKAEEARDAVLELHSYDVPCVLGFSATANFDFLAWVRKEVG